MLSALVESIEGFPPMGYNRPITKRRDLSLSAVPLSQKLVVLCMLTRCQHPLTSQQIDVYMLENKWSDYMLVQQLKAELVEAGFVTVSDEAPYFYMITREGMQALNMFISAHMQPYLRNQVENFVANSR